MDQPGDDPVDVLHRVRAADQRQFVGLGRAVVLELGVLRLAQSAPDYRDEFLEVEGFGEVFVGAALGRLDRGGEGVLRAHDDDRQVGPDLLDARDQLEGVFVRHDHVGDHHIAVALAHPVP
jgi:hypothetical protein